MSMFSTQWREVDDHGNVRTVSAEQANVIFLELGVTYFDRRLLDPNVFATQAMGGSSRTYMTYRNSCLVAKFGNNGAVCKNHVVYIADGGIENRHLIEELSRRVSYVKSQVEDPTIDMTEETATPFLTSVLDTLIDTHFSKIEARIENLNEGLDGLLRLLASSTHAHEFQRLQNYRTRATENVSILDSLVKVLEKSLEETKQSEEIDATGSLTVLMHTYLIKCGEIREVLDRTISRMTETEKNFSMRIDSQRNQILKFELLVSTFTFAVSIISAISGLMGMNLDNTLYMPPISGLFIWITCVTGVVSVLTFAACGWYFKYVGIF